MMGLVGSGAHPTIVTSLVRAAALVGLESVDDNWLVFPTSCQVLVLHLLEKSRLSQSHQKEVAYKQNF